MCGRLHLERKMAGIDLADSERYERILRGPTLPLYSITKSTRNIPGEIFTSEFDYQTKYYATYHVDSHPISAFTSQKTSPRHVYGVETQCGGGDIVGQAHCYEYHLEDNIPTPDDSYNKFHNVIPIKKEKKDKEKKIPLVETKSIETALPVRKQSTNILKGSVLKPSITRKDGKYDDTEGEAGEVQPYAHTRPTNYHPRVTPALLPSSSTKQQILISNPEYHSPTSPGKNDDDDTLPTPSIISQQSGSSSSLSIPPHVIHNRLMGWKLTSPERRKELIHLFEHAHSLDNHEDDEEFIPEDILKERKRVFKRQTDAYETTINRISSKNKNKLKYSIKSDKKFSTSTCDQPKIVTTKDARRKDNLQDPFQQFLKQKGNKNKNFTKKLFDDIHHKNTSQQGESHGQKSDRDLIEDLTSKWGFSSSLMKPVLPDYQNKSRDPKILFEQPDRMELLESAIHIEKAASMTISNNLELSRHSSKRTLRLPSMDPNAPAEQKLTKVVSEPFLREISIKSANRKKRELAEERKMMEESEGTRVGRAGEMELLTDSFDGEGLLAVQQDGGEEKTLKGSGEEGEVDGGEDL